MTTEKNGVTAYRQNNRSVEGLSKDQLGDIMEEFPETSDAYRKASQKYNSILEMQHDLEPRLGDVDE